MRSSRLTLVASCCGLLVACATPGPKLADSVTPIAAGIEQAQQQSDLAFSKTNEMARDLDVARVLANNPPNLSESAFPQAIRLEDRKKWATAFSVLETYTRSLQNLVDPTRAEATKRSLAALGNELNNGTTKAGLPEAAIAGFSQFARVLVQLHAERTAQQIMRQTDPAFRDALVGMADAIGSDDRTGLRFTTRAYWASTLADIRTEYSAQRAQKADSETRKVLATQFVKAMDDREAQLADLGALRDSLMALAEAHHAAAYGDQGDALFWIQRISTWLDEAKSTPAASTQASGDSK